ncbi:MAG: hypothetical protein WC408_01690 [Candidatus Micrarchaeia archaeon]|jgi:hypothetical protein
MAKKQEESPVSKKVQEALESDIYVKQALKLGIANCSAIAKKLSQDIDGSEDALKMAVLRFGQKVEKQYECGQKDIGKVLAATKIALLSNICVLVFERSGQAQKAIDSISASDGEIFSVLASQKAIIVITNDEFESKVISKVGKDCLLRKSSSLCMLRLSSPENIESVPGVASHIIGSISEHGINIEELYSCYTDTNLVVARKDALKAFEILEKMCRAKPLD